MQRQGDSILVSGLQHSQVGTLSRVIKVGQEMYKNSHVMSFIAMYSHVLHVLHAIHGYTWHYMAIHGNTC